MGNYLQGTQWHYGQPTQDWTLTSAELNHYMKLEIILQCLMEAGIHNFDGYDEAMKKADKEFKSE